MKNVIAILATCFISSLSYASDFQKFEEQLLAQNLINEDYQYTDVEGVATFFEQASREIEYEELNVQGEDPQLIDLTYTPYLMEMVFKASESYDELDRKVFNMYFSSDDMIQDGCDELYTSQVFYANNYVIKMLFLDGSDELLGNIRLDKYICQ